MALPFFTGMVVAFTAEQRPLSRQLDWPFSPEYQLGIDLSMNDNRKLTTCDH